jgi:hypothetical protein
MSVRMSSYSKLPASDDADKGGPRTATSSIGSTAVASAERVKALATEGASRIGKRAQQALAGTAAELEALVKQSDLPSIDGADAVTELASRLDREADLWRSLAVRELARATWAGRVALGGAAGAVVGDLALATVGGFAALFGAEQWGPRAALLLVAGVILTLGAGIVALVCASIRRAQREIVRDALVRADLAELRLHRVAIVMAWRTGDPALFHEALARLERDAAT